jgi:hypothetical protein
VTVLQEGGHIAAITDIRTGVNPLWTPPWPSIEPSTYSLEKHPEYGHDAESKLLAGIMGHNLCLDIFGGVSDEEAAAGLTVHGEGSVVPYQIDGAGSELIAKATLPNAQLRFERRIRLATDSRLLRISETVENVSACDHPVGWTEHVTLGPPFLEKGSTEFRAPGTRSKTIEGRDFDWPLLPREGGGTSDLRVYTNAPTSEGFTTHLMDPHRDQAFFLAFAPKSKVLFGYAWKRTDFPWLGIWEENYSRKTPPWNGKTLTRGMEFGASPIPETRRQMIERGGLFGVPGYRWIPAKSSVRVEYCAFLMPADRIAESVSWDGAERLQLS